ncbi:MAG TPA: Amuc_1100 family pilus-like protein, partial [Verrucomicrobiae bacterium]|nr:Amuc_1100 family pilus-like protein [Verrucomicrobiae bacterium]
DYISERTTSNSLAVLTPYEITFRSFSSELATVLAGFASSPHALLVKTINVEAAPPAPASEQSVPLAAQQVYIQQPVVNPMQEEMERQQREAQAAAAFRARYGNVGGGQPLGGIQYRGLGSSAPQPGYAPSVAVQPGVSPTGKGGLPTVLDEKLLKITLSVYLLKPVPTK